MELDRKSKRKCRKSTKEKPELIEKNLRSDTPSKGVDAKYSIRERKKNVHVLKCRMNNNNENNLYNIKKNLKIKGYSIKNCLKAIKIKKLSMIKNFKCKKNGSALTEKEETCNKMTKVAALQVKMVEPFIKLIDFEEEIKVEKISKDENKIATILENGMIDCEEHLKESKIENIKRDNNKNKTKSYINSLKTEIDSSSDSDSGENFEKLTNLVISVQPKTSIALRRNPTRKLVTKNKKDATLACNQINDDVQGEKTSLVSKPITRKLTRAQKHNLPLNVKDSNRIGMTSKIEKKKTENNEENYSELLPVPSAVKEKLKLLNSNRVVLQNENQTENSNPKKNTAATKKRQNNRSEAKSNNNVKSKSDTNNDKKTFILSESEIHKKDIKIKIERNKTKVRTDLVIASNEAENLISSHNKTRNIVRNKIENNVEETEQKHKKKDEINTEDCELKIEGEINTEDCDLKIEGPDDLENLKEIVLFDDLSLVFNEENTIANKDITEDINTLSSFDQANCQTKFETPNGVSSCNDTIENLEKEVQLNEKIEEEVIPDMVCEEKVPCDSNNNDDDNIDDFESLFVKPFANEENDNLPQAECQKTDIDDVVQEDRFFIFDEAIQDKNALCKLNANEEISERINEKICGEIIHEKKEDFSINCYMCWDDDNWTFKKFSDLKLFSAHLNANHSNDQIHLQNKRGNSFSLDFVNQNSCVMPKSMWQEHYHELYAHKCGLAKVDSDGFIHYSCIECKQNFKNFNAFTKHIVKRGISESGHGNCSFSENHPNFDNSDFVCANVTENSGENLITDKDHGSDSTNINMENTDETKHKLTISEPSIQSDQNEKISTNEISSANLKTESNAIPSSDEVEIPDIYGFKKITSALFDIFNNKNVESVTSKLDKILSIGEEYKNIKEKEKNDLEQKEKDNAAVSTEMNQKDTKSNVASKNKSEVDEKPHLLVCKYCNRSLTCLTTLRAHNRVHVGERIVLCNICNRGFPKKGTLDEHVTIFHSDSAPSDLDLEFLGKNRREIAKNTNVSANENNPKEKGYKCEYCPRYLSTRNALTEHLRLHIGDTPVKCDKCDLKFLKNSIYLSHLAIVHNVAADLKDHAQPNALDKETHNTAKETRGPYKRKFKCRHCPKHFPVKVELVEHLISCHDDGEYKCKYCSETFDTAKKCSYHEKVHEANSKYQCTFCQKNFPNVYTLAKHENDHNQMAHFKCRFCDSFFASQNTRNLHEEIHEAAAKETEDMNDQIVEIANIMQMNNEQGPINSNGNANDSNGTSSDATDRSSNQNTTTRNLMVKKIIKKIKRGKRDPNSPLDCRYCKKHFESPHQLSYHERLHEIGKKFQCNLCDKIMATSYALELHLTAHLKKKNFPKNTVNSTSNQNGYSILANQLEMHKNDQAAKPKIEIVSNVSLAPKQTMEILNNFFKREVPAITVTTTSEDASFQKIGVVDIEKNLTAHVLRNTDPYYQLMADFSYQYQMCQNKFNPEFEHTRSTQLQSGFVNEGQYNQMLDHSNAENKRDDVERIAKAQLEQTFLKPFDPHKPNHIEMNQNQQEKLNPQPQELSNNTTIGDKLDNNSTLSPKEAGKKKEKKKILPDAATNEASDFIKCEYCNKKFSASDSKSLNRHRRLHIAGDTHKCSFCGKCFASLYYLDRHLRIHHLNSVNEYKCQACDSVYALKEALRRHEIRAHKETCFTSNPGDGSGNDEPEDDFNCTDFDDEEHSAAYVDNDNCNTNTQSNFETQDEQGQELEFAIPEIPKTKKSRRSKELKLFDCHFCEKALISPQTLQKHIDRVHKNNEENFETNYNLNCAYDNCKKRFNSQANLEKHLRLHVSGYKCAICGKMTISQILLDHHMRSHGVPTSYCCKYCSAKFTMQITKDIHEKKSHSKGAKNKYPNLLIKKLRMCKQKISYRCYNCKKSFTALKLLKTHTMYKHPSFECTTCPAVFQRIADLEEHAKIHLKTLQCNLCDKTFENKHTLYKHRRQHETKFFKCNMCPEEFSFRDELNEHKKNHDESERPFKCVEMGCDKGFVVETFLNTHLKKTHGYFLFNCDRCKREFLKEDSLLEHRKEHEMQANDMQYRCDQCFKDFSTAAILKIHQKLHQSGVVAEAANSQKTSKLKLYTCERCNKRFSIVTYLNNHLKKVHQVKLFLCEVCKMEFRNEKDLQEHNKVHLTGKKFIRVEKTHLDRPFKCELCGISYAILAYLNNHLNKAHGNEEVADADSRNLSTNTKSSDRTLKNNENVNGANKLNEAFNGDSDKLHNSNGKTPDTISTLPPLQENPKKKASIKCDHCYLRFVTQKHMKDHSKMHLDSDGQARIQMLESALNPNRSEKILNPIISSSRANNNSQPQKQQQKGRQPAKKQQNVTNSKKRLRKQQQQKPKTNHSDEESNSSLDLIEVSQPLEIPDHNLSYTQITEALSSASTGLTAIQPVELIANNDEDQPMATNELTPLTTLTSLSSLTPLTPMQQPSAVFHHSGNDENILESQLHSSHLTQAGNASSMDLESLHPSTISEATKLSLTLLEPSALSELTAFTEPNPVAMHTTNINDHSLSYGVHQSAQILNNEPSMFTELVSSSGAIPFENHFITTQSNNTSSMLNTSSASSDYAVTNMDTSQITQQAKKPRISDFNVGLDALSMLDDNSIPTDLNPHHMTEFTNFDGTHTFLSSKSLSDHNMTFPDLGSSSKSILSDGASLDPQSYSDSMPLSEATTILELTSSSQPTSSSEATAFSELHNQSAKNMLDKKKRNTNSKPKQRPNDSEIINLEGDFDTSLDNNQFKCTLCKKAYDCWLKFRKHNEYHILRPYQCPVCPCSYKTNEELLEHNSVHLNSNNNFACEICNRVFVAKTRLKAHTMTVHNDERQFKCDYCSSAFKTKSRLVDHVRSHTGEKPIKCHYCDEHFARAAYRLKHERAVHPELLEIDTKHREEKLRGKKIAANEK